MSIRSKTFYFPCNIVRMTRQWKDWQHLIILQCCRYNPAALSRDCASLHIFTSHPRFVQYDSFRCIFRFLCFAAILRYSGSFTLFRRLACHPRFEGNAFFMAKQEVQTLKAAKLMAINTKWQWTLTNVITALANISNASFRGVHQRVKYVWERAWIIKTF